MKRPSIIFYIAIFFFLVVTSASAQDITYLDDNFLPTTSANFTYKRVIKFKELILYTHSETNPNTGYTTYTSRPSGLNRCSLIDYFKTGRTALVADIVSLSSNCSNWSFDGGVVYYWQNGNIKRKEFYKSGKLEGTVIRYSWLGEENKREEYADGKLIEADKFSVSANSPIIGTWKYVEYIGGYDFGMLKKDPTISRISTYIYSQNGVVESIHEVNIQTIKNKGNWKYIPKTGSSGVLEEYLGNDLIERGNVIFLNPNKIEYTITFSQNSDSVGQKFIWTKQ